MKRPSIFHDVDESEGRNTGVSEHRRPTSRRIGKTSFVRLKYVHDGYAPYSGSDKGGKKVQKRRKTAMHTLYIGELCYRKESLFSQWSEEQETKKQFDHNGRGGGGNGKSKVKEREGQRNMRKKKLQPRSRAPINNPKQERKPA